MLFNHTVTEFDSAAQKRVDAWIEASGKDWSSFMLADLERFIEDASLGSDEYFGTAIEKIPDSTKLFKQPNRQIAFYWSVGSNEGYYVSAVRFYEKVDGNLTEIVSQNFLTGKFWDWKRAQFAVNVLQYLVNKFYI